MSIVLIVIYCLIAAVLIFGLTFQRRASERKNERKQKRPASVISIEAGKRGVAKAAPPRIV